MFVQSYVNKPIPVLRLHWSFQFFSSWRIFAISSSTLLLQGLFVLTKNVHLRRRLEPQSVGSQPHLYEQTEKELKHKYCLLSFHAFELFKSCGNSFGLGQKERVWETKRYLDLVAYLWRARADTDMSSSCTTASSVMLGSRFLVTIWFISTNGAHNTKKSHGKGDGIGGI